MHQKVTLSGVAARLRVLVIAVVVATWLALYPSIIFNNSASADCQKKFACEFLPSSCPDCAKTMCGLKYRNRQPFRHYLMPYPQGMLNWEGYDSALCAEKRWCHRDILQECPGEDAMYVCEETAEDWEDMLTYVNWLGWNPCPEE